MDLRRQRWLQRNLDGMLAIEQFIHPRVRLLPVPSLIVELCLLLQVLGQAANASPATCESTIPTRCGDLKRCAFTARWGDGTVLALRGLVRRNQTGFEDHETFRATGAGANAIRNWAGRASHFLGLDWQAR
jgi:hypothetical protein